MFTAHSMLSTVLGPQEAVVNKSDFLLSRGLALVDVHSFVNLRIHTETPFVHQALW